MSFNSIDYLIFFPVVVLMYFCFPQKIRTYWLLFASYYYYMSWNAKYGLIMLFSTSITYVCGISLGYLNKHFIKKHHINRIKSVVMSLCIIINLGLLFYFKYFNFAINNLNMIFSKIGVQIQYNNYDIVLPVGISFFIFQAVGYTIDVYRDEIDAEKNFFRYALFVSFFPQLVAGPIERSKNLLNQLKENHKFDVDNAKNGHLTIAYGIFVKIAIADNISAVIDPIFEMPGNYSGMAILFATVLFAFQIYCDFNGYTQIAIGSAQVLGFKLNQNFDTPYLGKSVKDFWRRWHISLTSWFRDYLYIPLGGSKKGKIKKQFNTMVVFLCSGLWHGADWHYVVWGGMNGLFSVLEDILQPLKDKIYKNLKINTNMFAYRVLQRLITFILIDFTWLFFRAPNLTSAIQMLRLIGSDFRLEWFINFEFLSIFDSSYTLMIVMIPLLIMSAIDVIKYWGKDIKDIIFNQQVIFRWMIYAGIIIGILYWGRYGTGYEQTQFIYFQF